MIRFSVIYGYGRRARQSNVVFWKAAFHNLQNEFSASQLVGNIVIFEPTTVSEMIYILVFKFITSHSSLL
ncbi:hypothetical protein LEP1GSC171_2308 [Leptospira santarosai str. HAI1380]|nr:hypothetical protein LEP1GSC171_2308 [Leptospira santarosai str. HAI1380]